MIHAVKSVMVGLVIVVVSGLVYGSVQAVAMPVSTTPQGADKNSTNTKALTAGWQQRATQRQYYEDGLPLVQEWRLLDGKWYYFDDKGAMAANRWVGSYYLGKDGAMLAGTTTPDGYTVDGSGKWVAGAWQHDSTGFWYRYASGAWPRKQWEKINGKWYYFDDKGYMVANTWIGNTYYVGQNGAMLVNTITPDGYVVDTKGKWVRSIDKETARVAKAAKDLTEGEAGYSRELLLKTLQGAHDKDRAKRAVESLQINYTEQAKKAAHILLSYGHGYARQTVEETLVRDGKFTQKEAKAAVAGLKINYAEQAKKVARGRLDHTKYRQHDLVQYLTKAAHFTDAEARKAVAGLEHQNLTQ